MIQVETVSGFVFPADLPTVFPYTTTHRCQCWRFGIEFITYAQHCTISWGFKRNAFLPALEKLTQFGRLNNCTKTN